jgi:hypothetical protein
MVAQRDACLPRGNTQLQLLHLEDNQRFDPEGSGGEGEFVQKKRKISVKSMVTHSATRSSIAFDYIA